MFKKDIYKYKDDKGRTIISPYRPNCEYEHMYRLISQSEDYRLTNYVIFTQCVDVQEKDLELWFEVHKDDLETPISQNEEVKNKLYEIQSVNELQEELLDTTFIAIDETYTSLEELIMVGFSAIDELYTIIEKLSNTDKGGE
jgi:hypothetical protein